MHHDVRVMVTSGWTSELAITEFVTSSEGLGAYDVTITGNRMHANTANFIAG